MEHKDKIFRRKYMFYMDDFGPTWQRDAWTCQKEEISNKNN